MPLRPRNIRPRSVGSDTRVLIPEKNEGVSRTFKGDVTLNANLKNVRLLRPDCYKKGGVTSFRVWPTLDPENPTERLSNGRLNPHGPAGLQGMAITEPAYTVQFAGLSQHAGANLLGSKAPQQFSYVIARNKLRQTENIGFWDEPYVKLYTVAKAALKAGIFANGSVWNPQWNLLLLNEKNPAIPAFSQKYFVVVSLYDNGPALNLQRECVTQLSNGQKVVKELPRDNIALGDRADDPLIVLQLPVSAGKKLLELSCLPKQDYSGDPDINPGIAFVHPDPCGRFQPDTKVVKGGRFYTLYNPDCYTFSPTEGHGSVSMSYAGVKTGGITEYEVVIHQNYIADGGIKRNAGLSAAAVENILSKQVFLWRESDSDPADSYLLHEPSIEERCVLIAKGFAAVPDLLRFAWNSHPEYLNFDEVRGILNARTVGSLPDNGKAQRAISPAPKSAVTRASTPSLDDEEEEESSAISVAPSPVSSPTLAELLAESEDEDDETLLEDLADDATEEESEDFEDEQEAASEVTERLSASLQKAQSTANRNRPTKSRSKS